MEHHTLKIHSVPYVKDKVFGQAFFKKLAGLGRAQGFNLFAKLRFAVVCWT